MPSSPVAAGMAASARAASGASCLFGVRHHADVLLPRRHRKVLNPTLKHGLGLVVRDRGEDHALGPRRPVYGRGDLAGVGQLQPVQHAEELGEVAARGRRVEHRRAELLVLDEVDGARGEHVALPVALHRVEHPVLLRDLPAHVRDDGESDLLAFGPARGLDVGDPAAVALRRVDGKGKHLAAPLLELLVHRRRRPQLGRAHRGVVRRVGEEDGPIVPDGGVRTASAPWMCPPAELGHDVAELHRKGWSLSVAQTIACGAVLAVIECEPIPKNVCPFERSCGGVFWQGFNPQSEGLVESARRLATDPYMLPAGGRTRLNPCRGGAGADNPPGNREGRARRHAEGGRVDKRGGQGVRDAFGRVLARTGQMLQDRHALARQGRRRGAATVQAPRGRHSKHRSGPRAPPQLRGRRGGQGIQEEGVGPGAPKGHPVDGGGAPAFLAGPGQVREGRLAVHQPEFRHQPDADAGGEPRAEVLHPAAADEQEGQEAQQHPRHHVGGDVLAPHHGSTPAHGPAGRAQPARHVMTWTLAMAWHRGSSSNHFPD